MAVLRNGKPIDEQDHEHEDRYRMEAMREYRRKRSWGGQMEVLQSGAHHASDTPRHWKHNRNLRA